MLEGYEVLRKISDGAAAEVFLARPASGGGHVIAEVMRPELTREPALASSFAAAARARLGSAHPNVARRIHSGVVSDGRHWLVSEPVGESLASRLAARGAISPEALIPLAVQLCDGLESLHQAGIVHGNLKPATVYVLEREGQPAQIKLLDFSLAFLQPGRRLPRPPGIILVEPEYLAPERVQGQRATRASDLYAVGVLLYELLTGFPPFTGADSAVVRRRQIEEPPAPLPERCEHLAKVIERCLAKDPGERFPRVAELKAALQQASQAPAEGIDIDLSVDLGEGQVVGSYELERVLGRGAMGKVFLARHRTLDRRVALKLLRPELARSGAEVDRFIQEAQAVNRIQHDHIVEIYDCVDETLPGGERRVYLVMELLEGRSLGETLAQGPLPLRRALRVMRQVALALDAMHRVGVVHRDVKPDNIFLTPRAGSDFVKMLDFGVAKLREQGLDMVDGVPVVVGTPSHMAPEQVLGRLTDHRTDVFAVGVVLYRLLSGRLPFQGKLDQMVSGIVRDAPPPLPLRTQRDEEIPQTLRRLVAACLEKDPERRPQTMTEVGTALEGLLEQEASPPSPVPVRSRWQRVRALAAAGLAAVLVVAATALAGRESASAAEQPLPAVPASAAPAVLETVREVPAREMPTPLEPEVDLRFFEAPAAAKACVSPPAAPQAAASLQPAPQHRPGPKARGRRGMNRDDVIDPFGR